MGQACRVQVYIAKVASAELESCTRLSDTAYLSHRQLMSEFLVQGDPPDGAFCICPYAR